MPVLPRLTNGSQARAGTTRHLSDPASRCHGSSSMSMQGSLRRKHVSLRLVRLKCASSSSSSSTTSSPSKPAWAGAEDVLSQFVNALIASPLYTPMKFMARRTLINTAEKNGVNWTAKSQALLENANVKACYDDINNPNVENMYPDYYLMPFHAYDEGNLNWLAAAEAESATYAMALRVWPNEDITWQTAQGRLRDAYCDAVKQHRAKQGSSDPARILDMGCSVGISTRALAGAFDTAKEVVGLDLSAYMLAVAELRERSEGEAWSPQGLEGERRISYVHGLAESTGMPDASFDVVSLAFVLHECPTAATRDIVREAARLLRPGGTLVMCDNDPKSEVIQKLPPVIFTLMKSTEPHSDEYYVLDMMSTFEEMGLTGVETVAMDPRHRAVLGTKQ